MRAWKVRFNKATDRGQDSTATGGHAVTFNQMSDVRGGGSSSRSGRRTPMLINLTSVNSPGCSSVSSQDAAQSRGETSLAPNTKTKPLRPKCKSYRLTKCSKGAGSGKGSNIEQGEEKRSSGESRRPESGDIHLPHNSATAKWDSVCMSNGDSVLDPIPEESLCEEEDLENDLYSESGSYETDEYGRRIRYFPPDVPVWEAERRAGARIVQFENPVYCGEEEIGHRRTFGCLDLCGFRFGEDVPIQAQDAVSLNYQWSDDSPAASSSSTSSLNEESAATAYPGCSNASSVRHKKCNEDGTNVIGSHVDPNTHDLNVARAAADSVNRLIRSIEQVAASKDIPPGYLSQARGTTSFDEDGVGIVDPVATLVELGFDRRRRLGRCPCHTPDSGIELLDTIFEEGGVAEDWSAKVDNHQEQEEGDSEDDWLVISPEGEVDTYREPASGLLPYNVWSIIVLHRSSCMNSKTVGSGCFAPILNKVIFGLKALIKWTRTQTCDRKIPADLTAGRLAVAPPY
ncbi:hypothetical protein PoB_001577200 [Plakobranchus ocellatus]|uniref:Uncharacterized protein n=1 Tax=Plakobranchus ocellatus TaxID=259542 RepID=A0AAV3Z242_9GAST|nr:hypothetical protein PoB_001577200 [Plakobranchus ocellatus]